MLSHWNRHLNLVDVTVVVGRETVVAIKDAHHAIALGVQSSLNMISIMSHSTGVPVRFVVIDVIACASHTISKTSQSSVSIAGVVDCVVGTTLFVILLLVNVCTQSRVTSHPPHFCITCVLILFDIWFYYNGLVVIFKFKLFSLIFRSLDALMRKLKTVDLQANQTVRYSSLLPLELCL